MHCSPLKLFQHLATLHTSPGRHKQVLYLCNDCRVKDPGLDYTFMYGDASLIKIMLERMQIEIKNSSLLQKHLHLLIAWYDDEVVYYEHGAWMMSLGIRSFHSALLSAVGLWHKRLYLLPQISEGTWEVLDFGEGSQEGMNLEIMDYRCLFIMIERGEPISSLEILIDNWKQDSFMRARLVTYRPFAVFFYALYLCAVNNKMDLFDYLLQVIKDDIRLRVVPNLLFSLLQDYSGKFTEYAQTRIGNALDMIHGFDWNDCEYIDFLTEDEFEEFESWKTKWPFRLGTFDIEPWGAVFDTHFGG